MIKLFEHQEKALDSTKDFSKVAYYLDMGLGKTFVGSEKLAILDKNLNLVICQKSKISDWHDHFKKYYPGYKVMVYNRQYINPNNKTILIINYDLAWRRDELLKLDHFTLMLDESSLIKNSSSKRTRFILRLKPSNVILLSGTPVGGKYEELYSQLRLLGWKITKKDFYRHYILTRDIEVNGFKIQKVVGYKNVSRLKRKLREHGAVFMKTDEVFNLPPVVDQELLIQSTKNYATFKKDRYLELLDNNKIIELVGDTTLNKMLYERQLAAQYNHNKIQKLHDILESTESRVIIFYSFQYECEQLKKLCKQLDKPVSVVSGKEHDLSNYEKHDNSVTLIQYQAGAMGLNLQLSNKIIYFSLPLSSELFEQSKKRTHRIGQTKTCFYYYLITKGSIEEKIHATLKLRKDYTDALFEGGK